MTKLPDFQAWAVFAHLADNGSFSRTAEELRLSKATVSKIIARLEDRLGSALFHRTSRRLALSEAGRKALDRARRLLAEGEALESEASDQSQHPKGLVRVAAPMSFGVQHLAPLLPDFFALYPEVAVELSLTDELVDLVGGGFDLAVRIASLADSSLLARSLCQVRILLVGAPAYFNRHGRPKHPQDLSDFSGLLYTYVRNQATWRFQHPSQGEYTVTIPPGPLRANNAEALLPTLRAGLGIALLPEFLAWDEIAAGRLEAVLCDWQFPAVAVHLVTPPGGIRPRRVEVLMDFLAVKLAKAPWAMGAQK
jgi:DNA-binding transcriptional LysR family regulator